MTWIIRGSTYIDNQSFPVPAEPLVYSRVKQVDACALVSAKEASSVLEIASVDFIPSGPELERPGVWACIYTAPGNRQEMVQVVVDEDPARDQKGYIGRLRQQGKDEVPGVGESAYVFNSPAGFVSLDALVGDTLLQIFVSTSNPDRLEKTVNLARDVAERCSPVWAFQKSRHPKKW